MIKYTLINKLVVKLSWVIILFLSITLSLFSTEKITFAEEIDSSSQELIDLQTQLIITELYPHPASGENEWIELHNPTSETISLKGLELWDKLSSSAIIYKFEDEDFIMADGYFVAKLSKHWLNNTGDTAILYGQNGEVIDEVEHPKTILSKSFSRLLNHDESYSSQFDFTTPTKGEKNITKISDLEEQINEDQTDQETDLNNEQNTSDGTLGPEENKTTNAQSEVSSGGILGAQIQQTSEIINKKLQLYDEIEQLLKIPSDQKVKKEGFEQREVKRSYLARSEVSKSGVISAIIGGLSLAILGLLL
jgi:hypothetical protein